LFENREKAVKCSILPGLVVDWVDGEFANLFSTLMQGFDAVRNSKAGRLSAGYQARGGAHGIGRLMGMD